jgi:hypothetical protein
MIIQYCGCCIEAQNEQIPLVVDSRVDSNLRLLWNLQVRAGQKVPDDPRYGVRCKTC